MKTFSKDLMQWYQKHKRDLPWRHTKDSYRIWISEIMLQQTTVNAVIPYYEKWIKEFPSVYDVAKAPIQKVLKIWQGLGYYSRAKNIHKSAEIICREHNGHIPGDAQTLRTLPGFGPYTVGAVLSIAFDKREPIIDANVRRVVMRHLAIDDFALPQHDAKILEFLDQVMPVKGNHVFNQALMELGALICRNKQPSCLICPVKKNCKAFKQGIQEIIPRSKKKIIKNIEAVIAIIKNKDKYFIQKRDSKGLLADLWEFPGGKIKEKESPQEALKREVKEELNCLVESSKHLFNILHYYTEFKVNLHVFLCELKSYPRLGPSHKWVSLKGMDAYPMPSGSAKIIDRLKNI